MTALLEFKQKIKNLYGRYEVYLLPLIRFVVALLYFLWINENMGYMAQLNSTFVIVILAAICCILPPVMTVLAGFAMMVGHAYMLCMEAGIFMLVLVVLLSLIFLRFSSGQSIVLVCAPLSFGFEIPALLPIGSGLLGNAFTVFPAASGVILYYFIRQLSSQAQAVIDPALERFDRFRLMADGLIQNWAMWLTVLAFVVTILMVYLIRTRMFDYAWRISIIAGGVTYILVMIGGSFYIEGLQIQIATLLLQTIISVVIGIILEFFFFGGDYSRTERLEYEDDDYYYYVKAIPKAFVATSERSIKKITGQPAREDKRSGDKVVSYEKQKEQPRKDEKAAQKAPAQAAAPVSTPKGVEQVDFERKLEESLKDL
ncbi:MAG: hypothetical protein IJX90_02895 [Blautia sp.]|nr:hypothetical protein [Blautia sp.]